MPTDNLHGGGWLHKLPQIEPWKRMEICCRDRRCNCCCSQNLASSSSSYCSQARNISLLNAPLRWTDGWRVLVAQCNVLFASLGVMRASLELPVRYRHRAKRPRRAMVQCYFTQQRLMCFCAAGRFIVVGTVQLQRRPPAPLAEREPSTSKCKRAVAPPLPLVT